MKAYVKDTSDILKKLPKQLSEDEMLMTMVIESLYTNIFINLGLSAIKYWTENYPQISKFQSELILEACDIVLSNNSFIFNNENFIQINCTAMGTKMAPTYATLTLGYLE